MLSGTGDADSSTKTLTENRTCRSDALASSEYKAWAFPHVIVRYNIKLTAIILIADMINSVGQPSGAMSEDMLSVTPPPARRWRSYLFVSFCSLEDMERSSACWWKTPPSDLTATTLDHFVQCPPALWQYTPLSMAWATGYAAANEVTLDPP